MNNHELQTLLALDRTKLPGDGGPGFNRLIFSNSPYLLQHAQNPVNWRQWGEEAKAEAMRRNLPLFVSIGYATCHWCHVMAHESFEDEEVADILNHAFVPVKVDREERPDLDEFCMAACQTMTGSGGWPLNCFMKPDGTPFYAMTYLPKEPRRGMPGFMELLENIAQVWQHKPDAVDRNAASLMEALQRSDGRTAPAAGSNDFAQLAEQACKTLERIYDRQHAGFGSAPKFPMPPYLHFLLHRQTAIQRQMALHSLQAMRKGGIWDQLGGGIHRYSTDRQWLVPHFEKMLYDQALVAYVALEAYELTKDDSYLEMADNLLEFVLRELRSPDGGFYCGLDADSEGREGACYVWKIAELQQLLGSDSRLFCDRYGVTVAGNFEEPGENVLFQAVELKELAPKYGLTIYDAETRLQSCCQKLMDARQLREQPLRDEKVLSGWNGLMIAALAKGASISGNKRWLAAAKQAASFTNRTLTSSDGRLMRSHLKTVSDIKGFLEDYSWLAWGYLELFIAGTDPSDLSAARRICSDALQLFKGPDGHLRTAGDDAEQMPVTLPDLHDGVIPSSASVLAMNLIRLSILTGEEQWQQQADNLLLSLGRQLNQSPSACLWMLQAGLGIAENQK